MILKIKYLGHAAFLVESYDGVTVVTDPFNDNWGYSMPPDLRADIVLISHNHPAHNCTQSISGLPSVMQGVGDRALGWIKIKGLPSFLDRVQGEKLGNNTLFVWDMRAIRLAHLGAIGHLPSKELLAAMGKVDILMIPTGGGNTLEPAEVVKAVAALKPALVLPMLYRNQYNKLAKRELADLISVWPGEIIKNLKPSNQLEIERSTLQGKSPKLVLLEYQEPVIL